MSASSLQEGRNTARTHNQDLLINIGFIRLGGSSLFSNGNGNFILSPGISEGKHLKYWFDVREANLAKIGSNAKAWVFLRIVPDLFALFAMERMQRHMNPKTQELRKNSGIVYGFHCVLDKSCNRIVVAAKNDRSATFDCELLNRAQAQGALIALSQT
jgi:hypothetical protein